MSKPIKLTPRETACLISVWRSPSGGQPAMVLNKLQRLGLIRHSFNEFYFRWAPGCSANSGWLLTDAGKALVAELRPARNEEIIAALETIPHPTDAQARALRQMKFWNATDDSTPNFTATPVKG